ncbi:MAG: 50S ribosomal protein L5 [Phycisphaerales bacterium]
MASDKDNKNKPPQQGKPKDAAAKSGGGGGGGGKPKGDAKGKKHDTGPEEPAGPRVEPRLQTRYKQHVAPAMGEKFGLKNPNQRPRVSHVTINVNMGRHLDGAKIPANVKTTVLDTIQKVTGQKPVVLKAKKSVSNFKVREGVETAAMVTLRRDRMWHFLDRFINLACPRIKDFRGLKETAFDGQGNYSCGINEQGVFPEINMAEAVFTHGMNINISFTGGSNPEMSRFILAELGMPFRKPEENTRGGKK